MNDVFAIPELTRGLRSFASPTSLGERHDRYFAPLLDARRAAGRASRWTERLTAFDAERLHATMRATLGTFAAARFPKSAPDRRALAAQLEDSCGNLFDALDALGAAEKAVRAANEDGVRGERWDAWVATLREVFVGADRGWEHVTLLLDDAPQVERVEKRAPAKRRR